jgi:hypothetical protein
VRTTARTIHFGTPGAEAFWEDPGLARLPSLPAPLPDDAVAGMDELLLALCEPGDALVTLRPFDPDHAAYLCDLGFAADLHACGLGAVPPVCQALATGGELSWFRDVARGAALSPWAVTPHTAALRERLETAAPLPDVEVVRRVNSKVWSTRLRDRLGLPNPGIVVERAEELGEAAARLGGPVLVKEALGVSGSGLVAVASPERLERLITALRAQEARGRRVLLVVEPLFERAFDFSAQLTVDRAGRVTLDSIQAMHNRGFAYGASAPPEPALLAVLERAGYEAIVREAARALYAEGYFGPVCVDSLVTREGEVVPIVEINARQSMGRINSRLDARFEAWGRRSWLTGERVTAASPTGGAPLLAALAARGLLWRPAAPGGVVPLGLRSLPHGGGNGDGTSRAGRLWVAVPHELPEEVPPVLGALRDVLGALGYRSTEPPA